MANHSQVWHDGASTRRRACHGLEGSATINNKLDNLGRDIKKITEKVHAI